MKVLKEVPSTDVGRIGGPRSSKYDELLDGQIRVVVLGSGKGCDFDTKEPSFRNVLSVRARSKGLKARIRRSKTDPNTLYVQAFPADGKPTKAAKKGKSKKAKADI